MSSHVIILGATNRLSLNQPLIWKTRTPPRIWGSAGDAHEHDDSSNLIHHSVICGASYKYSPPIKTYQERVCQKKEQVYNVYNISRIFRGFKERTIQFRWIDGSSLMTHCASTRANSRALKTMYTATDDICWLGYIVSIEIPVSLNPWANGIYPA